jgi:hypothetical protein
MTFKTSWAYRLFGDSETKLNVFGQRMSGQPYNYVYKNKPFGGNGGSFANVMYVPQADRSGNVTLTSNPNVQYDAGFDVADFNDFRHASGLIEYAGQIAPRNEFSAPWSSRVDMSVEQEVEVLGDDRAIFHIQNLGNLLNNDWGRFASPAFFPTQGLVSGAVGNGCDGLAAAGTYCYSNYNTSDRRGSRVNTATPRPSGRSNWVSPTSSNWANKCATEEAAVVGRLFLFFARRPDKFAASYCRNPFI